MASMKGSEQAYHDKNKNPGTANKSRMVPGNFARNNLAKGGVNSDIPSHVRPKLAAGKAHDGKGC